MEEDSFVGGNARRIANGQRLRDFGGTTGRTARIPQTVKAANKATTTVKKPAKAAEKAKPKSSPQPVVNLPKRDDGYTFPRGN